MAVQDGQHTRGFYRGWLMVALTVATFALVNGATSVAFGVFVAPVSAEFGLSRASANTAVIVMNLGGLVYAPIVGRMVDRFSLRAIMGGGGIVVGLALIALSRSRSLWLDVFIIAVPLSLGMAASAMLSGFVLVGRWFEAQRGRAMSIAAIGLSLAAIAVLPVIARLVQAYGWRDGLLIVGGAVVIVMAAVTVLVRDRPRADEFARHEALAAGDASAAPAGGVARDARPALAVPAPVRRIVGVPAFWLIAFAYATMLGVFGAIVISLVPLAELRGFTVLQGTSFMAAMSMGGIAGKAIMVFIADRFDRAWLLVGAMIIATLFILSLARVTAFEAIVTACFIGGVVSGACFSLWQALLADTFGTASLGTANGLMAAVLALSGALWARVVGEVFDRTGAYDLAFYTFASVSAAAALGLVVLARGGPRLRDPLGLRGGIELSAAYSASPE